MNSTDDTVSLIAQLEKIKQGTLEFLKISGRDAFVILPRQKVPQKAQPWVWYTPTVITCNPNGAHAWMFQKFIEAGLAVAGVDIGVSFGRPEERSAFTSFHAAIIKEHGFSSRVCLLAQSRGALAHYNWASEHPQYVSCIAGIYPVCDIRSFPGIEKASDAYRLSVRQFETELSTHNPIDRLSSLVQAKVPILHIHGDADAVVPLLDNSSELIDRYRILGGQAKLIVVRGKGHDLSDEFRRSQELVDFVIQNSLSN